MCNFLYTQVNYHTEIIQYGFYIGIYYCVFVMHCFLISSKMTIIVFLYLMLSSSSLPSEIFVIFLADLHDWSGISETWSK